MSVVGALCGLSVGLSRDFDLKRSFARSPTDLLLPAYVYSYSRACTDFTTLSPLLQVKEVIRKERHKNQMETRKTLNKLRGGAGGTLPTGTEGQPTMSQRLGMFPPLNVKGANLHLIEQRKPSELAMSDVQKVSVNFGFCLCCSLLGDGMYLLIAHRVLQINIGVAGMLFVLPY
jgi:hypothetical protein